MAKLPILNNSNVLGWYYFIATGWIKDNGKDYLLYSNGAMVNDWTLYGYNINGQGVINIISKARLHKYSFKSKASRLN